METIQKRSADSTDELIPLDALIRVLETYGHTDTGYLRHHYERFRVTLAEFDGSWDRSRGVRLLDIGAHWLHQSLMWRRAGYDVTAMDLPVTLELSSVRAAADGEGIGLVIESDLERCPALASLPDDSVNVVLFAEIIEHITFNPVHFWSEVYRVLAPGGRIVITTPNYYSWFGRAWDFRRFRTGFGGGVSVDEVLTVPTYGHHWREFALHELIRYFCLLSPDFNVVKMKYMRNYYSPPATRGGRLKQALCERVAWLRPNLHLEIELTAKQAGIVVKPSW